MTQDKPHSGVPAPMKDGKLMSCEEISDAFDDYEASKANQPHSGDTTTVERVALAGLQAETLRKYGPAVADGIAWHDFTAYEKLSATTFARAAIAALATDNADEPSEESKYHYPHGPWYQPNGKYSGHCACGVNFEGGTVRDAEQDWLRHFSAMQAARGQS